MNPPGTLDIGVFGARSVPSTYSGYETFLTAFLPELVQRGHTVTMYTRERDHVGEYRGVQRRYLPSIATKQLDTLSHGLVASVVSRFARHDVVFVCNVANAYFLPALTWTGTPTVLNVDGLEWKRDKWGDAARRVFKGAAAISRRTATVLVTDCEAMRAIYQEEFDAPSVSIPYPCLDLHDVDATMDELQELLDPHALTVRSFVLVAARHNPENNIVPIVRSHLATDSPLPIVVLGTANYSSPVGVDLAALAAKDERVRVLGHIGDRATFGALLRAASVYFHGHSVGGINPSLIEAMGAGAFIAALDTPFNREALGDAGRYFVDPETAAHEILGAADDAEIDAGLRAAARRRAVTRFAMEDIVARYEAAFHQAVAESRGDA